MWSLRCNGRGYGRISVRCGNVPQVQRLGASAERASSEVATPTGAGTDCCEHLVGQLFIHQFFFGHWPTVSYSRALPPEGLDRDGVNPGTIFDARRVHGAALSCEEHDDCFAANLALPSTVETSNARRAATQVVDPVLLLPGAKSAALVSEPEH